MRALGRVLLLVGTLGLSQEVLAGYDDLSTGKRVGYTALAVVENVVPVASALATPRCLHGYVLCKLTFAGISLVVAGEQLFMSGGADLGQTRAVLHRGFAGDWVLTGRHAAGDVEPQFLPDPGPATPTDATVP